MPCQITTSSVITKFNKPEGSPSTCAVLLIMMMMMVVVVVLMMNSVNSEKFENPSYNF
jgi:hypothetical protein